MVVIASYNLLTGSGLLSEKRLLFLILKYNGAIKLQRIFTYVNAQFLLNIPLVIFCMLADENVHNPTATDDDDDDDDDFCDATSFVVAWLVWSGFAVFVVDGVVKQTNKCS